MPSFACAVRAAMLGSDSQRVKLACHLLRTKARSDRGARQPRRRSPHGPRPGAALAQGSAARHAGRRTRRSHSSTSSGAICPSRQASYTSINAQTWIKSTRLCGSSRWADQTRHGALGNLSGRRPRAHTALSGAQQRALTCNFWPLRSRTACPRLRRLSAHRSILWRRVRNASVGLLAALRGALPPAHPLFDNRRNKSC